MAKIGKFTTEMVHQEIRDKFDGKYQLLNLENYNGNSKIYVDVFCTTCKTQFNIKLYSLLFGKNKCDCPTCKKNEQKEKFIQRVNIECGNEYLPLSEYKTCKDKVLFKHNKADCMNEFWMTPDTFFNGGSRCPICMHRQGANKLFISHKEFSNRIKSIHNDEFTLLGKYNGYNGKIKVRHKKCGREFEVLCGHLLQGKGCRYCAGKMLITTDEFKQKLYKLYNEEYSLLGNYVNAKTKVHIKHNLCGYEWDVIPRTIMERRTCPHCNKSSGEKILENFAIHNKLNYKTQETFDGCSKNDYLKFDMSIYDNSNTLLCLIEFDGSAHFVPTYFGNQTKEQAIKSLKDQQERDKIKNDFCRLNDIPLLRLRNKDSICLDLKNYFLDNFNIITEIPNKYHYKEMKTPAVKFLEIIKKLPNGIYPKSFFSNELSLRNGQKLSLLCLNQEIVKEYMTKNNIINHSLYIEINCNNDNYLEYIKIGTKNNFDFELFRNIKSLYYLPNGKYLKSTVGYKNRATVKCNTYEFYNRFINNQSITFTTQNLYKNMKEVV